MSLALAAPPLARADDLRAQLSQAVSLFYIGHRLGHPGRTERWLRARVDWLTSHYDFPAPLPAPRASERRYSRRAVDAWFDRRLPPGAASANGDCTAMAAILDARAANLHQLGEQRGIVA